MKAPQGNTNRAALLTKLKKYRMLSLLSGIPSCTLLKVVNSILVRTLRVAAVDRSRYRDSTAAHGIVCECLALARKHRMRQTAESRYPTKIAMSATLRARVRGQPEDNKWSQDTQNSH